MSDNKSTPTDFNDLHLSHGIDAVQQQIFSSLDSAQTPARREPFLGGEDLSQYPPEQAAPPDDSWQQLVLRTKDGVVKACSGNVELILRNDERWKNALGYCDFSYRVIKHHAPMPDMQAGEWEDADTARVIIWLAHNFRLTVSKNHVQEALIVVAQKARFHPVRDYLSGLVWDGRSRLNDWLKKAMNSPVDEEYLALAGKKFLIGAVARVMHPGCKMDNVLILEGEQGKGKSTIVSILFGDWYSDAPLPLGDKDAYQNIQGVWGAELAELDSFNKAESTTAKMFFSQVRDRYRPSYGHTAQDFPRQCVFIGTTNQEEYLKDYTGNRRYWPVTCLALNTKWIKQHHDQLWAEALHFYQAGEKWWPDDDEVKLFIEEQDKRLQIDPWQYPIEFYLRSVDQSWVTADMVLVGAIKKDNGTHTRADQNRLAPMMKLIGWHKRRKTVVDIDGSRRQRHVYVRPNDWDMNKKEGQQEPMMPDDE